MNYTFHIVDVFSSTPFGGNQLAVLPNAAGERSSTNPRGSFGPGEAYTAGNVRDFGYGTSSLCVVEIRY